MKTLQILSASLLSIAILGCARSTNDRVSSSDPACTGSSNPFYSIGYGIEHTYDGAINASQMVHMVLSCDHRTLQISGAVQQRIDVTDVQKEGDGFDLADLSSGTEVIRVKNDYNFDGNNDLETITSNGQGAEGIKSFLIFIYDPHVGQFIYNAELSALENISPEAPDRIVQNFCHREKDIVCSKTYYQWQDNHLRRL